MQRRNITQALVPALEEIRGKLGLPRAVNPALFERSDCGAPHVECSRNGEWYYIVTEHGLTLEKKKAKDLDEMLYWLASDLTFAMACSYELKNRVAGRDCRRIIFTKELELMEKLGAGWSAHREAEIASTLAEHPYVGR